MHYVITIRQRNRQTDKRHARSTSATCSYRLACRAKSDLSYHWYTYSMAGPRHALTLRSKGQRWRSQGYKVCCRRGCACRYDCL